MIIFFYNPDFTHWSTLQRFHIPYLLPQSPRRCPMHSPHPTRLPHTQVSKFLEGRCIFSECRPGNLLLYIRWFMLGVCWLSVWEIPGAQVSSTAGLPIVSPSSFSPSSSLSLIQPQGSPVSFKCLGINTCIWQFQLLIGPFGGHSG